MHALVKRPAPSIKHSTFSGMNGFSKRKIQRWSFGAGIFLIPKCVAFTYRAFSLTQMLLPKATYKEYIY